MADNSGRGQGPLKAVVPIIIVIIIIFITFMQGIYNHNPDTNHVSRAGLINFYVARTTSAKFLSAC
jgi:hypothetical protein